MVDRPPAERVRQISEFHCGPAVVQMLLGYLDVVATQEQITEAAQASETIADYGTRVDQLAMAVRVLAPHLRFWHKDHASLRDLVTAVNEHHYPAGVEWQGIFEDGDDDPGHYSIVTHVDVERGEIWIGDPYEDYFAEDRVLPIDVFMERWWDTNEVRDPKTGRARLVEDYHTMFIAAPAGVTFPQAVGMKSFDGESD